MAERINNITPWPENNMKNYQWLDDCLQKQPSTEKEFQPAWQAYKYLLCGKMYAYIGIADKFIISNCLKKIDHEIICSVLVLADDEISTWFLPGQCQDSLQAIKERSPCQRPLH